MNASRAGRGLMLLLCLLGAAVHLWDQGQVPAAARPACLGRTHGAGAQHVHRRRYGEWHVCTGQRDPPL